MSEAMRAPSLSPLERKPRSSRRQIPELKIAPPPALEDFDDLDWAGLEKTTAKLDRDRQAKEAEKRERKEELARISARLQGPLTEARAKQSAKRAAESTGDEFDHLDFDSVVESAARVEAERNEQKALEAEQLQEEQAALQKNLAMRSRLRNSLSKSLTKEQGKRKTEEAMIEDARAELRERVNARTEREAARHTRDRSETQEGTHTIIGRDETLKVGHEPQVIISEPKPRTVEEEVASLREKLEDTNAQEGKLQEQINEIKSNRTLGFRFKQMLAKVTRGAAVAPEVQKLHLLEKNLEVVREVQHGFIEDIQLLTHKSGLELNRNVQRGVPATPELAIKNDAARRADREAAQEYVQRYKGTRGYEDSLLGMDVEDAEVKLGLETGPMAKKRRMLRNVDERIQRKEEKKERLSTPSIEVHGEVEMDVEALEREEEAKRKAEELTPEIELHGVEDMSLAELGITEEDIKAKGAPSNTELKAVPGTERFIAQNKKKEASNRWTVEKAANVLEKSRASELWDQVNERMLANVPVGREIMRGSSTYPATLYVFELAKAVKAQQDGDTKAFEEATDHLAEWNKKLGYNNAYVNSILARRENMNTRGMKSVLTRRNRALGAERRFLRP